MLFATCPLQSRSSEARSKKHFEKKYSTKLQTMNVHIFGIRHHGPGSARNVLQALEATQPDIILVEGPPEGSELLHWVNHAEMKPPVALLAHAADDPKRAVFYPFTLFSPEWQAIQFGLKNKIPTEFMDMPLTHKLAIAAEKEAAAKAEEETKEAETKTENKEAPKDTPSEIRRQPIAYLAEIAGYKNAEEWWEQNFEMGSHPLEVFSVLNDAMSALREHFMEKDNLGELQREAFMRQAIRKAQAAGHRSIAVVCGAWHGPALVEMPTKKADTDLLKGLPKMKVEMTWIPWTNNRLMTRSGYGAGIESPGYYEHNWKYPDDDSSRWLTLAARVFRERQKDISAAHIIEGVKLAQSLVTLRNLQKPGLTELNEAVQTVMCMGDPEPLLLLDKDLIIGQKIGEVPSGTPRSPLQVDFEKQLKSLRLKLQEADHEITLDLRKPNDLKKSILLNRLQLLGINWGTRGHRAGKGNFKEVWRLYWQPELLIGLIEKAVYGNTILTAAQNFVKEEIQELDKLDQIVNLLNQVIPAELPEATQSLIKKMDVLAASTTDTVTLMQTVLPLVDLQKYGNVRQTDQGMIQFILRSVFYRMIVGLPISCSGINDEQAQHTGGLIREIQQAVQLLNEEDYAEDWYEVLEKILANHSTAPFIQGLVLKILYEVKRVEDEVTAQHFSVALSENNDPAVAAQWLEGFLYGAAMVLILDDKIWNILFNWVSGLEDEVFDDLLPLLRRSFADYTSVEKVKLGEKVKKGGAIVQTKTSSEALNAEHSLRVVPVLKHLMNIK